MRGLIRALSTCPAVGEDAYSETRLYGTCSAYSDYITESVNRTLNKCHQEKTDGRSMSDDTRPRTSFVLSSHGETRLLEPQAGLDTCILTPKWWCPILDDRGIVSVVMG